MPTEHECEYGPFERSRFAGTPHRKCLVAGCESITLDDDEPDEEDADNEIKLPPNRSGG